MLHVLKKILSYASAKKKTKMIKGFSFPILLVVFKWHRGIEGVKPVKITNFRKGVHQHTKDVNITTTKLSRLR